MARHITIAHHDISIDEVQDLLVTDHPMVQQFRFVETSSEPESLHFALQIIPRGGVRYWQQRDSAGHRVRPVRRTLFGHERIGEGNREIWLEGDELVAENCTFFPNQEFNDLGIGSALYVAMERLYRHLGIRRVTLLAVDIGVYVWARQGFAFADDGIARGLVNRLRRFVGRHTDLSLGGNDPEQSWDFANYDVPDLAIDGDRVGKAFMLDEAGPWHGIKLLDDDRHSAIAEASRRETFSRLPDKIEGAASTLAVR